MNENMNKYRLVLGDELLQRFSISVIKKLVKEWAKASGALNVASSVIVAQRREDIRALEYTVYFDSSAWTGAYFPGFNTKNRNFS